MQVGVLYKRENRYNWTLLELKYTITVTAGDLYYLL